MRILLGEMVEKYDQPTVVDIEAGLEHLSRGTLRHVETLLIVVEPYFKSMETAARMHELGRELGIGRVMAVANKLRSRQDQQDIYDYCYAKGVEVGATVPLDETVEQAERRGVGPLDVTESSPAIEAIRTLAGTL